jgi:hypothetical protein
VTVGTAPVADKQGSGEMKSIPRFERILMKPASRHFGHAVEGAVGGRHSDFGNVANVPRRPSPVARVAPGPLASFLYQVAPKG